MNSEKFKGKYRIPSARMRNWNYTWAALYFITICTKDKFCWFGDIINGKMHLSKIGRIVETEWQKTFEMRPDMNMSMGEFVVMPNHFHAIIGIGKNAFNNPDDNSHRGGKNNRRDAMHCVSTGDKTNDCTNDCTGNSAHLPKNKFGSQSKNLASVVRGFKSSVTINARLIQPSFAWQPRFHDHIIRDEQSFQQISDYIKHNTANWKTDTHHQ